MKNKLSLVALAVISTLSVFGWTETYHYDANGRLSQVSGSLNESYKYDSRGNIQEIQKEGETVRFEYDRVNQLKQRTDNEGVHTFVYDKAGRLTEENLNGQLLVRYTYGYLDKVTSVERDGQLTKFRYNGDGMLVEKEYPDGTLEKWSWDRLALIARGDERYINEPHASGGVPIMSLTAKGVRYHTSDYLGTTLWSTDEKGKMTDCYAASPYGQGKALADDPAARFTGKPYDKDLGAFVFPFRNYDSKNVRWMSVDPSGFPDGANAHFYACNPLREMDPLGLASIALMGRPVDLAPNSMHTSLKVTVSSSEYASLNQNHTQHFSSNADGSYSAWISGYPSDNVLLGGGHLELRYNDPTDISSATGQGAVTDLNGKIDLSMGTINDLFNKAENFVSNHGAVEYELFPDSSNEGNCNALSANLIYDVELYANFPDSASGSNHFMNREWFRNPNSFER